MPRSSVRVAFLKGDGLFWDREPLRLYTPEQVHAEYGLPLVTRVRPYDQLLLDTVEWHRELVLEAVEAQRTTDVRPSHPQIMAATGFSRSTVKRQRAQAAALTLL